MRYAGGGVEWHVSPKLYVRFYVQSSCQNFETGAISRDFELDNLRGLVEHKKLGHREVRGEIFA